MLLGREFSNIFAVGLPFYRLSTPQFGRFDGCLVNVSWSGCVAVGHSCICISAALPESYDQATLADSDLFLHVIRFCLIKSLDQEVRGDLKSGNILLSGGQVGSERHRAGLMEPRSLPFAVKKSSLQEKRGVTKPWHCFLVSFSA